MVWMVDEVEPVIVQQISPVISDKGPLTVDYRAEKMRTWGKHLRHRKRDEDRSVEVMLMHTKD